MLPANWDLFFRSREMADRGQLSTEINMCWMNGFGAGQNRNHPVNGTREQKLRENRNWCSFGEATAGGFRYNDISFKRLEKGTRIWRLDGQDPQCFHPERGRAESPWWCLLNSAESGLSQRKGLREGLMDCLNYSKMGPASGEAGKRIPFGLYTRYQSAVKIGWNTLANYVEAETLHDMYVLWGPFQPMEMVEAGALRLDREGVTNLRNAMRMEQHFGSFKHGRQLGSVSPKQLWIPEASGARLFGAKENKRLCITKVIRDIDDPRGEDALRQWVGLPAAPIR